MLDDSLTVLPHARSLTWLLHLWLSKGACGLLQKLPSRHPQLYKWKHTCTHHYYIITANAYALAAYWIFIHIVHTYYTCPFHLVPQVQGGTDMYSRRQSSSAEIVFFFSIYLFSFHLLLNKIQARYIFGQQQRILFTSILSGRQR